MNIVDIQYSMYMTFHYNKFDFHFVQTATHQTTHFGS